MIFSGCAYILIGTILHKYGWNCSLDNKFINLYLTVCRYVGVSGARQNFCNETILVQKVVYIQSNFGYVFLNNALPLQLVTMQGKVLKN